MEDNKFSQVFDALEIETVRKNVLEKGHRIGGRGFDELRPLVGQVGLLPRTHGSALFNRGETQALATITSAPCRTSRRWTRGSAARTRNASCQYNSPPARAKSAASARSAAARSATGRSPSGRCCR